MPVDDNVFVSTSCLNGDRSIQSVLERMENLSIKNVELSGPHPYVPFEEMFLDLQRYRDSGMSFIIHNYFPPPEFNFTLNIASFKETVIENSGLLINAALDLSQKIGAPFYGCHAGYLADAQANEEGIFQFDIESIRTPEDSISQTVRTVGNILRKRSKNLPPEGILLENLFPATPKKNFSLACTPSEISCLLEAIDDERVGLLLDLAHLELTSSLYGCNAETFLEDIITKAGKYIKAVHLSGNDGKNDNHLPLEPGSWKFAAAKRIKETKGSKIPFTLECRGVDNDTLLFQIDLLCKSLGG